MSHGFLKSFFPSHSVFLGRFKQPLNDNLYPRPPPAPARALIDFQHQHDSTETLAHTHTHIYIFSRHCPAELIRTLIKLVRCETLKKSLQEGVEKRGEVELWAPSEGGILHEREAEKKKREG